MITPPRLRAALDALLCQCLSSAGTPSVDRPMPAKALHRDGRELPAEMTVSLIQREDGRGVAIYVRDLTRHRQIENELRESEERSQAILDHIEDGYFEVDLRGNYLAVNNSFCRIFGYPADEILGQSYKKIYTPEEVARTHEAFHRVYLTGESNASFEHAISSRDGSKRFVEVSISLKRNRRGQASGFAGIVRDCTERKLYEQELAKAKEAAEAANRAKSEFLANMSHEIRTPMNGVIGMTELVLSTNLTDEQRDFISTVRSSANSLLIIINDILDYSKIEAGKVSLDPVLFDLQQCVGDTMRVLAVPAHNKGLELAFHVEPELPSALWGDSMRLRQVLLNLTGNAIKFTAQGEVVVRVSSELREGNELKLHFSVRDTGIGIPGDKQGKLFQMFEQVDMSTTRQFGGTGLGLAISKRIVELMGGEIWMESTVGAGSTFHFTSRFSVTQASPSPQPASLEHLQGLPILIVDDNAANRRILEQIARQLKMLPETADSGSDGLAKLNQALASNRPVPLVLLDEQMPDMGGLEVIERIRGNLKFSGAAIMMLTSADQSQSAARCRELGIENYLIKPIRPIELKNAIRKALGVPETVPTRLPAQNPSQLPQQLHILVAEDNPVNQRVADGLLRNMGHHVTLAGTGSEAVARWSEGHFDLILMDVQMPEMDGFEATRNIRKLELAVGAHTPIVAMTAHAMNGDRDRCFDAGMDDYVSKPISVSSLLQAIADAQSLALMRG